MQDAKTRIAVAVLAAVALIAIGAASIARKVQSPPAVVITGPTAPPVSLADPATPSETSAPTLTPAAQGSAPAPAQIYVHVAGAVKNPGLYTLPAGTRLFAAIHAAGGAKPGADLDAVNLAEKLSDGEKVYIPTHEQMQAGVPADVSAGNDIGEHSVAPPASDADEPADAAIATHSGKKSSERGARQAHASKLTSPSQGTVDINTAGAEQLERLPGVGPAMAARILDFRKSAGGFRKPDELMEVRGIGPKKYAKLAPFVRVR